MGDRGEEPSHLGLIEPAERGGELAASDPIGIEFGGVGHRPDGTDDPRSGVGASAIPPGPAQGSGQRVATHLDEDLEHLVEGGHLDDLQIVAGPAMGGVEVVGVGGAGTKNTS
jgi:hypothetical protein